MLIAMMLLGILGVVLQFLARTMEEKDKPGHLVFAQYAVMISVVVLGAISQLESSKKEQVYKSAQLEIDVLSEVSQHFYPVLENMIKIQNDFLTVRNYLSYQKAQKEYPEYAEMLNWYSFASEHHKSELEAVKGALKEVKLVAAEILKLDVEYEGVVPSNTVAWAKETIAIKFEDIDEYFDPYAPVGEEPKTSVLEYADRTGRAFGVVIGRIRNSAVTIKSL
jgi:hypothetical protein